MTPPEKELTKDDTVQIASVSGTFIHECSMLPSYGKRVNLSSRIEKRSSLEGKLLAKVNQLRQAAGLKELSLGAWVDAEGPEGNMQSTQLSLKSPRKTAAVTQVSVPKKAAAVPKKMTSEQIAKEKERLQRLEREFAEKIKKLRQVQALTEAKNTATESSNLTNNGALQRLAEIRMQSASLKPSMQEYKKDKISLDIAIETEEANDEGPQVKKRRKSLLEMNPSTKPNLITAKEKSKNVDTPTAADVKATLAGKTELIAADKENITQFKSGEQSGKHSKENQPKKSVVFSLPSEQQLDRLRRLQQEKEKVVKFESVWTQQRQDFPRDYVSLPPLRLEMDKAGANLNSTDTMQGLGTIKTVQYKPYESPLQLFKSYRFNPYYRTKAKLSLSSVTFSNKINPHRIMCRFDIKGTCNDEGCRWQHKEDYNLTKEELFQDIVSFAPRLAGVKDMENITEHEERVSEYVNTLYKQNGEKMTADQMCLLFVSKVNDHHKNVAPHTMMYERRKWKPRQSAKKQQEKDDDSSADIKMPDRKSKKYVSSLDTTFTEDDPRYFTMDGVVCQDLESAVMEHPTDVQLWLKLAYQQLSRQDSESDSLDKALNVLSRGLESNGGSPELWQHYLTLFAKRGSADELREMCQEAVHFAPHYDVWSKCLELEKTFSGKDDLCKKILAFLKKRQEENFSNLQSHQLLETLLHRIHLHVQTRRYSIALNVFSTSLMDKSKPSGDSSCLGHLLAPNDRCLAWLSFIYLTQFHTLPPSLYDPMNSNPAKIVSKEPFILPWTEDSDLKPEVLLGHFQNALDACIDHTQPAELNTLICLPLYKNVLKMKTLLDRYDAAETLCRQILKDSPFVVEQWLMLADLHVLNNQTEQSRKVLKKPLWKIHFLWNSTTLQPPLNSHSRTLKKPCRFSANAFNDYSTAKKWRSSRQQRICIVNFLVRLYLWKAFYPL
ncbi:zinc finger C3H1 domain-containing protein-like [Ptychodera flava]|uniref:zinc finger C3H1 domain-containing protein-like n=1 Tax=Ptychodera flava TaxID=63121 RepID=UPI00396A6C94